ncbi:MAG: efflux RND transporter periplasmic adaptor subunit [Xanthobacteraceae bacterium]
MAAVFGQQRRQGLPARQRILAILLIAGTLVAACSKENTYAPPPPAKVGVATPLQETVKLHLDQTGNTLAYNTVDLVARVEGFLTAIKYEDGAKVKKGDDLFIIEQPPYEAQLEQAKAALLSAKAELVKSQAEFDRQSTLRSQDVSSQVQLDKARAQRDTDQANVMSQEAAVEIAQINLGYTTVKAPFDGTVTRHLVSVGEVVGGSTKTKLATIVQLDPIYVTFNLSEQEMLKIRENLGGRRLTLAELQKVPMEIGLMTEEGSPHKGHLDYVAPELDSQTGTILVRGVFENPDSSLLPGLFVRIQIPTGRVDQNALLVPDRALGQNQAGRYLLVLDKDDVVEQRKVEVGQQVGELRIISSGLKPDDRVVVSGIQRAIPGKKVDPQAATIAQTDTGLAPSK